MGYFMVKVRKDLTGMVFGRLTVICRAGDYTDQNGKQKPKWLCQCSCGSEPRSVLQASLKSGKALSCGCLRTENSSKVTRRHGKIKTSVYHCWAAMIQRCDNINNPSYDRYGGRGIKVCERWLNSFEAFYEDMGERPEGTSLDRIDVNGNYEPTNCRWTTNSDQGFNKRISSRNTSGRTGVYWHERSCIWWARIKKEGISVYLGQFNTFEEAVAAREAAELEYYGYNKE